MPSGKGDSWVGAQGMEKERLLRASAHLVDSDRLSVNPCSEGSGSSEISGCYRERCGLRFLTQEDSLLLQSRRRFHTPLWWVSRREASLMMSHLLRVIKGGHVLFDSSHVELQRITCWDPKPFSTGPAVPGLRPGSSPASQPGNPFGQKASVCRA